MSRFLIVLFLLLIAIISGVIGEVSPLFNLPSAIGGGLKGGTTNGIPDTTYLTIAFAGDVMGHSPQIYGAYDPENEEYNYDRCFQYVKPYIEQADIAVVNLEVTLAGPPYKGYPQFSSPDALAVSLKNTGFDIILTANNHSLDRGKQGLERTITQLDSLDIRHTGTFRNQQERDAGYPLIYETDGFRIALLNCTYGLNGLLAQEPNIINMIDTVQILEDLVYADSISVDFTIVTVHWGLEYERFANLDQIAIADFLICNGVDAVIGSHPHAVQPIEICYNNDADSTDISIVVYSLGNFVSNQRNRFRDGGIIFELTLMKTTETRIVDFSYIPVWVHRRMSPLVMQDPGRNEYFIVPVDDYYENPANYDLTPSDSIALKLFYDDTREHLKAISQGAYYPNDTHRMWDE